MCCVLGAVYCSVHACVYYVHVIHCVFLQTLLRQLAEAKDSLQFSNKLCEQLEGRAEETERTNASLAKLCDSQQAQLEQKTAAVHDLEEKLESIQRECQRLKDNNDSSNTSCKSCRKEVGKLAWKKAASFGGEVSDDTLDSPAASEGGEDLRNSVEKLTEKLRTVNYQREKYEKGLREVLTENQSLSRQLERAEADLGELQARLKAYEDAMEKQSLEHACSSPLVHSGHHFSVSSTPTTSATFQYGGTLSSPCATASGDDRSSQQNSLKTSRTTDSLLGTSLFSELDSQYSDLQEHYDELVQQCTCSAGLAHRNRLKLASSTETGGPNELTSLATHSPGAHSSSNSGQPFKDLFEEVFATLKQTAAVADKLVQRKKGTVA